MDTAIMAGDPLTSVQSKTPLVNIQPTHKPDASDDDSFNIALALTFVVMFLVILAMGGIALYNKR